MEIDDIIEILFDGSKEKIKEILEKEKITYNFAEDLQVYTIKNINTLEVVKGNKCHYKPNCVKYFGNNYNCI